MAPLFSFPNAADFLSQGGIYGTTYMGITNDVARGVVGVAGVSLAKFTLPLGPQKERIRRLLLILFSPAIARHAVLSAAAALA